MSTVTCGDVEPLLPLIADNVIDAAAEPAIFNHIAGCQDCQEALFHHDLVSVALVGGSLIAPRPRAQILRLPWPWAVASAAGLMAVCALVWQSSEPREQRASLVTPAVAAITSTTPDSDIEVVVLPGNRPGTTITALRRGNVVVILPEPQPQSDGTPVAYRRY